jgi:hypothetical protein
MLLGSDRLMQRLLPLLHTSRYTRDNLIEQALVKERNAIPILIRNWRDDPVARGFVPVVGPAL